MWKKVNQSQVGGTTL